MAGKLLRSSEQLEALRAFRIIVRAMRRHYQQLEKHTGISGAQTWALSLVGEEPGITVSGLVEAMGIHQSTASVIVEKLVQLGLVERLKADYDQRVTNLHITPAGQEKISGVAGPASGLLPDAIMHLDPKQLRRLNRGLADLLSVLSMLEADAAHMPLADLLGGRDADGES